MLRREPGKIFFPKDKDTTLKRLLEKGDTVLNRTLTTAFNRTTEDIIKSFKEFPDVAIKNTVCAVPYLIRKLREFKAMETPSNLRRRHFKDLPQRLGNTSKYTLSKDKFHLFKNFAK